MIDYDNMLFNIDIASGMPHPGAILVSEPFLREEYFAHAVICLVDYGLEESSMGVVMNRSTAYTLQGLVQGVSRREDVPVFCGGPMSCDRLYYLHTLGQFIPDSRQVVPGLYIGGDFNAMLDYVNSGLDIDGHIRFFIAAGRPVSLMKNFVTASGPWLSQAIRRSCSPERMTLTGTAM